MERKLVVGIRDFCILSSWKAWLEGNEKEKLTREVLSVLMVAQKSTHRREEWIKWGLFTVGFFVWSTPHCTVCPARWLVSSSSVCNPSSDPFVKSHRSPSSFTPCNIFWGISLPKTEQKDHFSCQLFKISNPQSDGCGGITWPSFTFSILSFHILSLLKIWSRYHEQKSSNAHSKIAIWRTLRPPWCHFLSCRKRITWKNWIKLPAVDLMSQTLPLMSPIRKTVQS